MRGWLKALLLMLALFLMALAFLLQPRLPSTARVSPSPIAPATAQHVIRLGTIDPQVATERARLSQFLKRLNEELASHDVGIEAVVAPDLQTMKQLLQEGRVDAVYDTPIVIALLDSVGSLEIVLNRHKEGVSSYHGVLFTRADSPRFELSDLAGQRFAAESFNSTSTFFLPLESFAQNGLATVSLLDLDRPSVAEVVNLIFSEMESVSLLWVLTGRVEAGAMKSTAFDQLDADLRAQLRVIHRTDAVPREVLALRAAMPAARATLLVETLAQLHETPAGRTALQNFEETTRFEPIKEPVDLMSRLRTLSQRSLTARRP